MAFRPLVSIIIPVYQGADYLAEAIESALAQTYEPKEVLVINDGSQDGGATEAVALRYIQQIRYLPKENGGVASALNHGITHARGEYVAWLSHDDAFVPTKIARQVELLADLDPATILYGDVELMDEHSRPILVRSMHALEPQRPLFTMLVHMPVNGCTTLIKRSCFETVGLFDEQLRTVQDLDMWLRLARRFPFRYVNEVFLRSRQHAAQGSRLLYDYHTQAVDAFLVKCLFEYGQEALFPPGASPAEGYMEAALTFARDRRYRAAERAYQLAMSARHGGESRAFGRDRRRYLWQVHVVRHVPRPALTKLEHPWLRRAYRTYLRLKLGRTRSA